MWNSSFLTQLHVVWHQALPIWLRQWPRPPNSYLLWGHFMFEVVRLLHDYFRRNLWTFVSDSLIGYEIGTRPIKNTVSYGSRSRITSKISQLRVRACSYRWIHWSRVLYDWSLPCHGRIGCSWLPQQIKMKSNKQFRQNDDEVFGAMTPWEL